MSEGSAAGRGWEPDPAQDEWDPAWDRDWEPPHDWSAEAAELTASWDDEMPVDRGPTGWTGEGEAFAAGFLHRDLHDDVPPGEGLASGGFLDQMEAGPVLALLTDAATRPAAGGHGGLGESELIGALCAWRRIASWAAAGQAAAVITLARRRAAQARERRNRHLSEHVPEEIAAALTLTGRAAAALYDEALALERFPQVRASLAAGRIDWPKASVFGRELAVLASDHDAQQIAGRVLPDAPSLTTGQLRARLRRLILARDPAADQQRKAAAARDADVIIWTEASGNAALAGRELPEADVLAADRRLTALARWLSGRGAGGSLGQLRAAAFMTLLRGCDIQSLLPPGAPATEGPAGPAPAPPVSGTIHLTMPITAWTGQSEAAGEIAGYGPAAASTCRDLAAALAASPATRWCLTLTSPAGHAIATARAAGHGPPPGPGALRWAAGLTGKLARLATADCDHARAEDRYQPSPFLQNLVRVRQPECCFPGCRQPARRCDLDHTIPHQHGGITCECNLAPTCRRHHRAKQAPHWHLRQTHPGSMSWQLPSGRTYQARPHSYPV